ncbi:TPA: terminase, partial [Klebsiella pneumoniae]|nr:terminase [Klebsiella pneumoniae]
ELKPKPATVVKAPARAPRAVKATVQAKRGRPKKTAG